MKIFSVSLIATLILLICINTDVMAVVPVDLSSECPSAQNKVLYQQSDNLWACVDLNGMKDLAPLYPASKAATVNVPYTEITLDNLENVIHPPDIFWTTVTINELAYSAEYDPWEQTDLAHIINPETNPGTDIYSDPQPFHQDKPFLQHSIKPIKINNDYYFEFTACQDGTCYSTAYDGPYPDLASAQHALDYYDSDWCQDYTDDECWWPRSNLPIPLITLDANCFPETVAEKCWWIPMPQTWPKFCSDLAKQGVVDGKCGVKYINQRDGDTINYLLYDYGKVRFLVGFIPPPTPDYNAALAQAKEYLSIAPSTAQWDFQPCIMSITEFSSSKGMLDPSAGEVVSFGGNITSSRDYIWIMTIAGQEIARGTGAPAAIWNGTDESGAIVADGTYTVKLWAAGGSCRRMASIDLEVKKGPAQCSEEAEIGSTVNTTSGSLAHDQELFSFVGGALPFQMSLFYNSLAPRSGPLAPALIEGYRKSLNIQQDGTVVLNDQNGSRTFTPSEGGYTAPDGDNSILVLQPIVDTPNSYYFLTEANGTKSYFNSTTGKIYRNDNPNVVPFGASYTYGYGVVRDDYYPTYFSSLTFNSINPIINNLGTGWTHSYNIALQDQGNGSIIFKDGNSSRLYRQSGTSYLSPPGDFSKFIQNADGTIVITEKDGLEHYFDLTGRIVKRTDRNGVSMTFLYDGGNMIAVTDGAGRVITFAYDETNKIKLITDPKGNTYSFTYIDNNLSSITNPDGGQWKYTYDSAGFLLTKTDPNGHVVGYTYDATHRLISSTDPEERNRSVEYAVPVADTIKTTTLSEKDGGKWQYAYDTSTGTLASKTDPFGNNTFFTYDNSKNLLGKTETLIGTSSYSYDAYGNVTSVTDSMGNTTSYTYNDRGQVLTSSGPKGNFTFTYDINGNLLTESDPTAAVTTYEYDAHGNKTRIIEANGRSTTFSYNEGGLLTSIVDHLGGAEYFTYDLNGNVATKTDANGKVTTFTYDSTNRLTSISDPIGNTTTYSYDKVGNRTSVTDANGNTTTYSYNYRGQITEAKDAMGNITTFTYGATGCQSCDGGVDKLTALTDAKGQTTRWQYDLRGQLSVETDPLQKIAYITHDAAGRMSRRANANGTIISFTHDPLGRLTGRTYPDGSKVNYSYNAAGFLVAADNSSITYTYTHDAVGRITSSSDSRGYSVSYEYDAVGNRTKMTILPSSADEKIISYGYDGAGRLTSITSPMGTFQYSYDAIGRRTNLRFPNQIVMNYGYDDAGRLTNLSHVNGTSAIYASNYTLDKVGNRTTIAAAHLQTFIFDLTYRLLSVDSNFSEIFNYDAVGNRQGGPGATDVGFQYTAANQMIQGRRISYEYDNNGNQITRAIPGVVDKTWRMFWNYDDQLERGEKVKGDEKRIINYIYDPYGRRIGKQLISAKNGLQTTKTWTYLYDENNVVMEAYTDENGIMTKTFYTHGPGIDEPLALQREEIYFFHSDGLGSIIAITNANKGVVQTYDYDSYGMLTPSTAFQNSYTYAGREWDQETGLYYYRARYYDPMEGRFIQKDPIGFAGGDVNLYQYVQNNPVNRRDPFGLSDAVVDRDNETITVTLDNGTTVTYPAGNNTTNPNGDPNTVGSNGPAPAGTFPVQPPVNTNGRVEYGPYFWPIGEVGPNGERADIARQRGIGLHCGRRSYESRTQGCIRMDNASCNDLYRRTRNDPLETITIR